MWRLRTTGALSVLALALGIAGTMWLSALTDAGYRPPPMRAARAVAHHLPPTTIRRNHHAPSAVAAVPAHRHAAVPAPAPMAEPVQVAAGGDLVPQVMTMDDSQSWERLRGHLDGQVLLDVSVDGNGRVVSANIARSSGDERLDAHAVRSVRLWRFAVPSDHPDGLHGQVPMRFTSAAAPR